MASFVGLARGTLPWTAPGAAAPHTAPLFPGTVFHRVIPGFMVQGGDPVGTGSGGPGYELPNETWPDLTFDRPGRLAMANAGPDTNGSQFFITTVVTSWLDGKHVVFGKVVEGMKVLDAMEATGSRSGSTSADVVIADCGELK